MEILFLCIVIFLFILAAFDLSVGVSNDAVNFLSSAVGSKAATFKKVILVASLGVFAGAAMSNGMMDIARHGIFQPENLSFYDVMAIFMAVMVTDVILLDIFNTLGMPTSTTVSMVFELLGATFAVALFKIAAPESGLGMGDLLNTEKALSVILGIFLSVAIAFVFGTIVQFISRLILTFEYKSRLKWKVGIFGGVACTAIVYFMLLKGIKDLSFMTSDVKAWIGSNTMLILSGCLVLFTLMSQILYWCKVNVFKTIVLLGTFSLAMAFAGNDLVNFIGVPLTSLSAYQDYMANGSGDIHGFMMSSLQGSASTPLYFLVIAGLIMVVALATSGKARRVTQTTVGLSSQDAGDEMFGSSRLGRTLVRTTMNAFTWIEDRVPTGLKRWISKRMDTSRTNVEDGAAFDLVRGAVNLMIASMLIAWGTSMKLPLSTTFVTFMVAMGTSLADKAWGRESAVFRITGVISVIGGWFITAGVAFIGAGIVVCLMYLGGVPVMIGGAVIAGVFLVRSNLNYRKKKKEIKNDTLFQTILTTNDPVQTWSLLRLYANENQKNFLRFTLESFSSIAEGFASDKHKLLAKAIKRLGCEKDLLKSNRRKLTLCFRRVAPEIAMQKNTWFHLENTLDISMIYNLLRISEACGEHVSNNFRPLPGLFQESFAAVTSRIKILLADCEAAIDENRPECIDQLRVRCEEVKSTMSKMTGQAYTYLQNGNSADLTVVYVYLNVLQESQEFVTSLRKLLRASGKLNLEPMTYRSFTNPGKK